MSKIRRYRKLCRLETFEERFDYLSLAGQPFDRTFGGARWLNQTFYTSPAWKQARNHVIVRDMGCDLGISGHEIQKHVYVHHMNPITVAMLESGHEFLLDPEYLITTSLQTHNAIHYGDRSKLPRMNVERASGDTKLW